jgi:hypothetical protein
MRPNAHHTLVVLAIAFATAAISVPGALGGVRPDDRADVHGIGAASATGTAAGPDWSERAVARHNAAQSLVEAARYRAIGPDWFERAVARHNATRPSAAGHPDDRGGIRGIGLSATAQQSPLGKAGSGHTFRWTDAAPWAGGALLLVLLLAAAAQAARHRRRLSVTY